MTTREQRALAAARDALHGWEGTDAADPDVLQDVADAIFQAMDEERERAAQAADAEAAMWEEAAARGEVEQHGATIRRLCAERIAAAIRALKNTGSPEPQPKGSE